jgi:DeoR/GlpR family transcriptional regulator of sugar metabolism
MLDRARRRVLAVDGGKFGGAWMERVCGLDGLTDLVTDAAPPPALAAALAHAQVAVTLASG